MAAKKNVTKDILAVIDSQFEHDAAYIVEKIAQSQGEDQYPTPQTTLRECPTILGDGAVSKAIAKSLLAGNTFLSSKTAEALKDLFIQPDESRYWHYLQGALMVYHKVYYAAGLYDKAADVNAWYELIDD
jgi:hypothetical protein